VAASAAIQAVMARVRRSQVDRCLWAALGMHEACGHRVGAPLGRRSAR
jgi:hypothetical protein